jgi:hypothetical protein
MDVKIEREELDKSIEVLSSAAQAPRLTRFETLSYRALMISVDAALVSFVALIILALFFPALAFFPYLVFLFPDLDLLVFPHEPYKEPPSWILAAAVFIWVCISLSILIGLISVALNIPLFIKVFRESARLKRLGLSSLSSSLWLESRRHQWISRARDYILIGLVILLALLGLVMSFEGVISSNPFKPGPDRFLLSVALGLLIISGLLHAARYLRNQRERIDLTTNAEELKNALQGLRQRAGNVETVTIPSELLEQTAKIESAQIVRARKDAVLQSTVSPAKEYAVAFDSGAREQRAKLDIADRVELEDLLEQLSTGIAEPESRAEGRTDVTATLRSTTKSKRVDVGYVIDRASRRIRVTAVQRVSGSPDLPDGNGHV